MPTSDGRPGKRDGQLNEGTKSGMLVRQRIYALIDQALDELNLRKAKGKGDVVATLANEIEKNPLAALKSLQELLPKDADTAGKTQMLSMQALWVQASRQMAASERDQRDAISSMPPLLDVTPRAEPVSEPAVVAKSSEPKIDW